MYKSLNVLLNVMRYTTWNRWRCWLPAMVKYLDNWTGIYIYHCAQPIYKNNPRKQNSSSCLVLLITGGRNHKYIGGRGTTFLCNTLHHRILHIQLLLSTLLSALQIYYICIKTRTTSRHLHIYETTHHPATCLSINSII